MCLTRILCIGVASANGIGRGLVLSFLEAGYCVGGIDIMPLQEEGEQLVEARHSKQFHFSIADISDQHKVQQAVTNILEGTDCASVSVLVNNAAMSYPVMPSEFGNRVNHWTKLMSVNLTGAFIMCEVLRDRFDITNGASIIHVSSTRAKQSEANCEAYAASKAGLCGLTHAQAISLGNLNIRVNCILPGWIDCGALSVDAKDIEWHPVKRVGNCRDMSSLVLFLSDTEKSGFITGQEFVVDGGVSVKMVYPEDDGADT